MSITERDGLPYEPGLQPFAEALRDAGVQVKACRQATHADIAELGSSWAKRLRIPAQRPAWLLIAYARQPVDQPQPTTIAFKGVDTR